MRCAAIIPVKPFDSAKSRLGAQLERGGVAELARAMLGDVLDAAGSSRRLERIVLVTNESNLPASETRWEQVSEGADSGGHSRAALRGIAALGKEIDCVVLLPGDCPLLDARELDGVLERAHPGRVGIVPDRHGSGTNGLVLCPPDSIEPAFGEGSRARHEALARGAGCEPVIESVNSLALDVDTVDDLEALRTVLAREGARAPRTSALLKRMASG
jgi:2-phospho-L-lactate/phosphoenolpyruvate guanylyltransferase